ncbi:hypothetical protein [Lacimicrobium alkaliphilum]|uniref:hypothetical protein n=1 Tax=Lacimicrobium alkaliphilum TaxID=1526571 RepID=UPI000AD2136D|nr:hypothetical protein [Lacimicrobium alkaliphilum]
MLPIIKPNAMPSKSKKSKKDSQLLIRIDKQTRDEFVQICEQQNTKAAKELRRFIQSYIKRHQSQD